MAQNQYPEDRIGRDLADGGRHGDAMKADARGGPAPLEGPEVRRPVRAVGLLLVLQVVGLAGLGLYEFTLVDWRGIDPDARLPRRVREVVAYAAFVPPAALMVLSALGFLFMRRRGWLTAAIAQGLCLAACLWLYALYEPYYVYPIMVYCVLMILYLNSQSVRTVFRRGRRTERTTGRDA